MTPQEEKLGAATYLYEQRDVATDIVNDYVWTLSRDKTLLEEVPYIYLWEYEVNESTIQQQISYYTTALENVAKDISSKNILSPYEKMFPRVETGNTYKFPYFSEINFEIDTPVWAALDAVGSAKEIGKGIGSIIAGSAGSQLAEGIMDFVGKGTTMALAAKYPKVGIMDRPRLWERHEFRTIEIRFPLFNTVGPDDWKKNRAFCWTLVNQNLYRKRDFITGIPPVYYECIIPGQHYSFAACVTNLKINNRGNMRSLLDDNGTRAVIPDAYEIVMTLTDMVMPSRNLLQYIRQSETEIIVRTPSTTEQENSRNLIKDSLDFAAGKFLSMEKGVVNGLNAGMEKINSVLVGGAQ